ACRAARLNQCETPRPPTSFRASTRDPKQDTRRTPHSQNSIANGKPRRPASVTEKGLGHEGSFFLAGNSCTGTFLMYLSEEGFYGDHIWAVSRVLLQASGP